MSDSGGRRVSVPNKLPPLEHQELYQPWWVECREVHGLTCNGRWSHEAHMRDNGDTAKPRASKVITSQVAESW